MKKFLIFVFKIVVLIFLSAFFLDVLYTSVYLNSINRDKIFHVVNSKKKEYDLVVLGSSRANNHFITKIFVDKGIKTYNYGMSGSTLQETLLLLKIMIENQFKIKNVLIEVDLNLSTEGFSEGTRAKFMPFIKKTKVISEFYENKIDSYNWLCYLPFYRYIKYEAKIGLREFFLNLIEKKSAYLLNGGFTPLIGKGTELAYDLRLRKAKTNVYYEEIKKICKQNNINCIAITTPICANTKGMNYFKKIKEIYPEIKRYDTFIDKDVFFSSCGHMNEEGARVLTERVIQDFFKK
ncbi:hypothetical protein [Flavobacterium columnare]|uniref:SGNH/GDSL hydrolase family protein n=1 Tax=Flavobacterium columnare TaxID=996 RepID=A0AAI8CI64_9FLAO|nr:hypothetical protein [Flavobacterium columnare]AMO21187.1 hypothetical protein UN65_13350 [Flavobacterium columnare]MEB3802229.1 hypothetical protein [Flavobacterium columnare]OOB81780.1 hypothetical protein BZL53_13610 [Flavobacterium columnare]QOG58287.1 hypothetical protein HUE29_13405 [Flavobacterium columnare]QOG61010.1 hypothetical protein HUE30_13405 [Flavobacterium columnare]